MEGKADTSDFRARERYAGLKTPLSARLDVHWGAEGSVCLQADSVVSITNTGGGAPCLLTMMTPSAANFTTGHFSADTAAPVPIDPARFDSRRMAAIAATRGANLADGKAIPVFDAASPPGEAFIFKSGVPATLFVIAPTHDGFIEKSGGSHFSVSVKHDDGADDGVFLPEPLGRIRDEWRINRGTARAYQVRKGQFIQIIDIEGQQCSDFMAMRADALDKGVERFIDSTVSRTMVRGAYPMPGLHDKFFDQDMAPLLAVRQDTVGRHDTFALACTARGYEERGFPGHLNCSDNITAAYAPYGIAARRAWPAINLFFNSWIDDNRLVSDEAWSRPGDYVVMQALTDLVCVSTACPDDIDPINGWNPTDVHVRVYEDDAPIQHAVCWRADPDDAGQMTRHSPFHPSTSRLTGNYAPAKNYWLASEYDATGAIGEYWACRNDATLQDMSSLLKFDIAGPDAEELLQQCLTRDVSKLAVHRGIYALLCDERGSIIDDGTLFRMEETAFRWCCGSEDSARHIREQAGRRNLNARILSLGNAMCNLAIQGPKSRDILGDAVFIQPSRPALENIKWFGFTIARLFDRDGPSFMLTRTGFTGELGYEIFCDAKDATTIWDGLMQAGAKHGLVAMGGNALSLLRVEAGLMAAGAEFGPDVDALESGLGFAIDFGKADFIGKAALLRNKSAMRRNLVGLVFDGNQAPSHGDGVFAGREQVGVITSACHSPELGHAIAMARIAVENSATGTPLEAGRLDGKMKRLPCTVTAIPFIDPAREKPRA